MDVFDLWKPVRKAQVSLPELERSLFLEVREIHKRCNSFIWDRGSHAPGCCTKCLVQRKGQPAKPLKVREDQKIQMYFYKLRNGMIYGTHQGIWNMN